MSGLGKGVVTSSIAKLLQLAGLRVSCIKVDPYLNYDAGTMNPIAHGEVFVTEDGGECDMDIGNYERFLNQNIPKNHNITTAQVFSSVIDAERDGKYLGACVQIIPHVTDEIKRRISIVGSEESLDVLIVECGGTVGDIESLPFLEALRQMRATGSPEDNVLFIHVTLAPSLAVVGEQKTKPTQHSVQELRRIGIQPDYLAVRCTQPLGQKTKEKLALFTGVRVSDVLSCHDAKSIFEIPQMLYDQGIVNSIFRKFGHVGLVDSSRDWDAWNNVVNSMVRRGKTVRIAMVGKYVTLTDSYVSVNHALRHAAADLGVSVEIDLVDSESVPDGTAAKYDGILVPGGFGTRGAEGIIKTAQEARINDVPYLGICFGFQLATVAFARDVLDMPDAHTSEIDPDTNNPVVHLLPDQMSDHATGGTLRLGAHTINIKPDTVAHRIYQNHTIRRRHRHRYEINKKMLTELEGGGMIFSAESDGGRRMEILEIPKCRFYMGVQFHPEFSSRPGFPEASYRAFVKAAANIT